MTPEQTIRLATNPFDDPIRARDTTIATLTSQLAAANERIGRLRAEVQARRECSPYVTDNPNVSHNRCLATPTGVARTKAEVEKHSDLTGEAVDQHHDLEEHHDG